MRYLDRATIIYINIRTVRKHGGNFQEPENMLNADRLDYAAEIVRSTVFGKLVYEHPWEVAAGYMFYIVTGHVFTDGNKINGLG
jgi:prophage maintenance system killer protein